VSQLHQKKEAALLLKLDIAGAFDSVSWGSMLELMQRLGFGQKWRNIISLLWSSSSSRVMANGDLGQRFQHRRGLRQGDPSLQCFSPLLLLLC
uniref:Reverse transcriptase domain-containing protein n=1 Tax=Aegilops tauschii subsp. strangulata TaxID=200361 RepID=A0A453GIZ5_AEGTS